MQQRINFADGFGIVPRIDDFLNAGILFYQHFQNCVQFGIRRQRVFVFLIRTKFCRRSLCNDTFGHNASDIVLYPARTIFVTPFRQSVTVRFIQIFQRSVTAARISVQRRIADGVFRLIAGIKQ